MTLTYKIRLDIFPLDVSSKNKKVSDLPPFILPAAVVLMCEDSVVIEGVALERPPCWDPPSLVVDIEVLVVNLVVVGVVFDVGITVTVAAVVVTVEVVVTVVEVVDIVGQEVQPTPVQHTSLTKHIPDYKRLKTKKRTTITVALAEIRVLLSKVRCISHFK